MLECEGRGLYVADEVLRPMASPHAQMFSLSVGRLKSGHSSTCFGVEEHLCDKLDSEFSVDGGTWASASGPAALFPSMSRGCSPKPRG